VILDEFLNELGLIERTAVLESGNELVIRTVFKVSTEVGKLGLIELGHVWFLSDHHHTIDIRTLREFTSLGAMLLSHTRYAFSHTFSVVYLFTLYNF